MTGARLSVPIALLLLAGALNTARSGDVQTSVDSLGRALSLSEGNTDRRLVKAAILLDRFPGTERCAGFRTAGKAANLVRKSGTTDPEILAATDALLRELGDAVLADAAAVETVVGTLVAGSWRSDVIRLSDRAAEKFAAADERLDTDPLQATRSLWKARRIWRKAAARGEKYLAEGGGPVPPGVSVTAGAARIENRSAVRYHLLEIEVTGEFRNRETGRVSLEVSRVRADSRSIFGLPGAIEGNANHGLEPHLVEFRWRNTPVALYSTDPHDFAGEIVLLISNRPDGEALWQMRLPL